MHFPPNFYRDFQFIPKIIWNFHICVADERNAQAQQNDNNNESAA